jgi:4-hydroxy-L-threonine phosphate dehydrogenase PdxA
VSPRASGQSFARWSAAQKFEARIVVIGDRSLFKSVDVDHVALRRPRVAGKLDPANSPYVLATLDRAIAGCLSGEFDAMVTAPVQKSVINDAGIDFTGHTEYLAEKGALAHVVHDAGRRRPACRAGHHALGSFDVPGHPQK